MDFAHAGEYRPIVFKQLSEHIARIDKVRVVVAQALQPGDVPNRSNRSAADFASSLRNVVGHCKDLAGLLIKQQVVVAEVRSTNVPMKILGLQIKGEHVRQQSIESAA